MTGRRSEREGLAAPRCGGRTLPPQAPHRERQLNWAARSIEVLPRRRAIQPADADRAERGRIDVASVHSDRPFRSAVPLVVGHASTRVAVDETDTLASPRVARRRARRAHDSKRARLVVRPESAVPPADRAVAARQGSRPSRQLDAHGAAVAGRGQQSVLPFRSTYDGSGRPALTPRRPEAPAATTRGRQGRGAKKERSRDAAAEPRAAWRRRPLGRRSPRRRAPRWRPRRLPG
jgi:hypothetical protein